MKRLDARLVMVELLLASSLSCMGSTTIQDKDTSAMETQTAGKERFPPHPGKILFRTMWNHTVKVESADEVPDRIKFIYYDADHVETNDPAAAKTRVPIVEVEMSSFDANGKPVDPAQAVRFSITQYGLHHQELRHTSGRGQGPKQ